VALLEKHAGYRSHLPAARQLHRLRTNVLLRQVGYSFGTTQAAVDQPGAAHTPP